MKRMKHGTDHDGHDQYLANEKAAHRYDEDCYSDMIRQAHADADAGKSNKDRKELPQVTPMPGRGHMKRHGKMKY